MTTEITVYNQWYDTLVDELKDLIVESEFTAKDVVIQCYHQVGTRILQENENFEREKIYGGKIVQRIAESLGKSPRTIYYAVQFAKMFPDLTLLPEGKNMSFHHIVNKYLTTGEKKVTIKKADLYRMIKEIKELLNTEWLKLQQERVTAERIISGELEAKGEFIRYLQDQVNKITAIRQVEP